MNSPVSCDRIQKRRTKLISPHSAAGSKLLARLNNGFQDETFARL